jgi:CxxC motif-containing protein
METRKLTCIVCPMGCNLQVKIEDGKVLEVTGNKCKRGNAYALKECTNPTRVVTTTVRVAGGTAAVVSVKTASDIPKGKISECMEALRGVEVKAPVRIGDVILRNAAGTGVDIVATKNIESFK